jgi:hypothetical protein
MCSYRNWYEYRQFVDPTEDSIDPGSRELGCLDNNCDSAKFRGSERPWWDSTLEHTSPAFDSLSASNKYRVHAHPCDRDYEHLLNMKVIASRLLKRIYQLVTVDNNC